MDVPEVCYARSGDVAIAYQLVGEGPIDLVFVRGFAGDLLSTWDQPLLLRHVLGLADFSRVIMLDKRGTGLSDRTIALPTLETRMDDLRAVMDDASSERAVLWSAHEGSRLAVLFAATYPERTAGLVLFDPEPRGLRGNDYPWAPSEPEWRERLRQVREGWGTRAYLEQLARELAPTRADDPEFRDWFVTHMRRSLSPGAAVAFLRMTAEADVSDVLAAVRVPTLILHRPSMSGPAEYVTRRIRHAEVVELPGLLDSYTWADDAAHALTLYETDRFVTDLRPPHRRTASLPRSSSPTSSALRRKQRKLVMARGAICLRAITPLSDGSWLGTVGKRSIRLGTASSRRSMARGARSPARRRFATRCECSALRSGQVCIPASVSVSTGS